MIDRLIESIIIKHISKPNLNQKFLLLQTQKQLTSSMLDSASKFKSNIPTCSICKYEYDSYYRIPRVIPKCGHTFCQKCINSSIQVRANRKMFICTQCNSQTVIRKGAADDVPKNIGILDIVKNMKKLQFEQSSPMGHKSPARDSPAKQKLFCRQHPSKQLDLVCETCNYEKVCSICALIGNSHQDHKFVEYVPASKLDLNEVKQVFTIIEDTVKQTILPQAQQNIIKRNEQNLIKMLVTTVKDHFKEHYYKSIEKKQNQIIAQVKEIKFDGGISKKIEEIAKHYDLLKIQYAEIFSLNSRKIEKENNASLQFVEQFIQKCKNLHNQVEVFSQHAQKQSKSLFKDISTKINQSTCFRINELPFSLKQLLTEQRQITSPTKYKPQNTSNSIQAVKKRSVDFHSRQSARGERSNSKHQEEFKSVQNICFDAAQRKPFTANSINSKNKSGFMPPKHKINKSDANSKIQKKEQDLVPMLDLDSKVSQKKGSASHFKPSSNTERLNKSSFENIKQQKRSVEKEKSTNKLNMSHITRLQGPHQQFPPNTDPHALKVREVRPQKQIPLQLKPKFSAITKQITRQAQSQSLQLIGMQITDPLVIYICQYLKTKRLKFSMIKLVKNNLTDEGLSVLLGHLQNDDTTQVLNLTSNQLTGKSLELFIELAGTNSFLKTIYLSHNKVSSQVVKLKAKELENLGLDIIV